MAWGTRFVNLLRRRRVDAEIDEELQFHIDERTRDSATAGMTPNDARRDAQRRFGGLLRARERTRDADVLLWLETIGQDVHFALRSFRHSPIVTTIIIASLALAIGASTAMFSIVHAVLLRALPYADPDRIVTLWTANMLNSSRAQNTSVPNLEDWKARAHTFEEMAAYRESAGPLMESMYSANETEWVGYAWVTDDFFSLLGRAADVGRVFQPDDFTGGRHVAVVTHSLWQRRFGGAADVIGKRLNVDGLDVDIVGVMPDDFWFPTRHVQVWVPADLNPLWQKSRDNRATRFGAVVGRLASGATIERARAEMLVLAAQLRQQYPRANADLDINLVPLDVQVLGRTVPFMLQLLFGAVLCVLLIACANVANLLLARGVARRREMTVRAALGAGRRRLARQLLTESVLLSCAGGALAVVAVAWSMRAVIALAPSDIPRLDEARVDTSVFLFALGLSVLTGALFGLVPAVRISRSGSDHLMHRTHRTSADTISAKMRAALVICQFALALVLLAGAGLLIRSLLAVEAVDSGFGDSGVVTAQLRFQNIVPRTRRAALYQQALERIRQVPGVRAAGAIGTMFWSGGGGRFGLRAIDGHPDTPRDQWEALTWTTIRGDYFQALGVPLRRGRFFRDADDRDAPPVALVNETMAARYWPGEDPIGHRIKGFDARGRNDEWVTVVGVVKDVHSQGLERAPMAQIFEAQSQSLDDTEGLVVSAPAAGLPEALRRTILGLDRTAMLSDVSTLGHRLREQSTERRFQTYLLTAFAMLALVLAAAGVFGTMHYSVVQRTQEIGIRMALGAQRRSVLAMVFRDTILLAAAGIGLGLASALSSMRVIATMVFGVTPYDPMTFAVVSLGLTAMAMVACCVPAARAARIDPILALRTE
jgi:putative ABC transport system permease protein